MKNVYYLKMSFPIPAYLFEEIAARAKSSDVVIREAYMDGKQRLIAHTTTPDALSDFLKSLPLPPLCLPDRLLCIIPDEEIFAAEFSPPEKAHRPAATERSLPGFDPPTPL